MRTIQEFAFFLSDARNIYRHLWNSAPISYQAKLQSVVASLLNLLLVIFKDFYSTISCLNLKVFLAQSAIFSSTVDQSYSTFVSVKDITCSCFYEEWTYIYITNPFTCLLHLIFGVTMLNNCVYSRSSTHAGPFIFLANTPYKFKIREVLETTLTDLTRTNVCVITQEMLSVGVKLSCVVVFLNENAVLNISKQTF